MKQVQNKSAVMAFEIQLLFLMPSAGFTKHITLLDGVRKKQLDLENHTM